MRGWLARTAFALVALLVAPLPLAAATTAEMARWIAAMKADPRGPFDGIFWFCNDGAVLPPEPYACTERGGGIQHGRPSRRTEALREAGYPIGNVLAATDPDALAAEPGHGALKAILLERHLVAEDDGWILRRARYYRGAFQIENEVAAAERILAALAGGLTAPRDYVLLRQATLLLPWLRDGVTVTHAHELSSSLATLEPRFVALRNKIHGQPDAGDAARVRAFARREARTEPEFEALAQALDALFAPGDLGGPVRAFAGRLGAHPVAPRLEALGRALGAPTSAQQAYATQGEVLMLLRAMLPELDVALRVQALKLSLDVEAASFALGLQLARDTAGATPAERLALLGHATDALYGAGLITARAHRAIAAALRRLTAQSVSLEAYRADLAYLARVPDWSRRELARHFGETTARFAAIEPLASEFVPARLRASPMLVYATVLDALLLEANRLAGIEHQVLGQPVGIGLRALNPGLARGVLRVDASAPRPDGIYLLPETTASLPPVAGILTLDAGNVLSHVQLLAAGLGIPNVVVDASLVPRLRAHAGRGVVLAASPGGRVLIDRDGPHWDAVFGARAVAPARLAPHLSKLELARREPIPLVDLRASDAGRIAGPKAANLGELKHHYPAEVADGLVIPFGAFHTFLAQPMAGTGMSAYAWMQGEYRRIGRLSGAARDRAGERLASRMREWILASDPGAGFRAALARAMAERFGPDGSYAVFVRSDTNVEDLPGFSGAGLNLTVPNVVGVDRVVEAIVRVWASPFAARAFAWRQMRLDAPEHVYVSVLLQRSVPVDKSGVMATQDLQSGRTDVFTVAANEGVGGAVAGEAAEELLVGIETGDVRLLAEASAPTRRVLGPGGGLEIRPASGGPVLDAGEIAQLQRLALELPERFPQRDARGEAVAADIEFGFVAGRLALFQIRPYLQSRAARRDRFLQALDAPLRAQEERRVYPWQDN